jgi:hypothetical protein
MILEYWVLNEKFTMELSDEDVLVGDEQTVQDVLEGLQMVIEENMAEQVKPKLIITDEMRNKIEGMLISDESDDDEQSSNESN